MQPLRILESVSWVGAIDREIRDFHGYTTPAGSTYNAYLLQDEKTVLFDTVKAGFEDQLLARLSALVDPERIDYIVVDHVELDHSGCLPAIVDVVKPEKIICSPQGHKALLAHFHREDWPYEVVKTGDSISTGASTLQFHETRMLHWPDSMFCYIPERRLLISQDAFGQHWATDERFDDEVDAAALREQSARYYANILLPYSSLVQKLVSDIRASGMQIDMIAPDHGLIWRSNPSSALDDYAQWSAQAPRRKAVVVFATMWHSTEMMASAVADGLKSAGVEVVLMNLESAHRADVITEILDARAVLFGSSTLNNNMLPPMADVLTYVKGLRPQNKIGAAFGSYGWGGEAVRLVSAAMEDMGIEVVAPGLRVNYVPTSEDLASCRQLGAQVGEAVLSS